MAQAWKLKVLGSFVVVIPLASLAAAAHSVRLSLRRHSGSGSLESLQL